MDISSLLCHIRCQRLILVSFALLLVLTQAVEESAPPEEKIQMWRETERDINTGGGDVDSYPAESQDTNTQRENHPNSAPLLQGGGGGGVGEEVEEERPWRPRNRTRNGNGKRRRRMRKRPRTTTPAPDSVESPAEDQPSYKSTRYTDRVRTAEDAERVIPVVEEEVVYPRRRPNKRRRRPVKRPVEETEVGSEVQGDKVEEVIKNKEEVEREIFRSRPGSSYLSEADSNNKSSQESERYGDTTRNRENFYRTPQHRVRPGPTRGERPDTRHGETEPDSYRSRPENVNGQRKRRKGSGRKRIRVEEVKMETTTIGVPSFSEEVMKDLDENKDMINRNEESRYSTIIVTSKVESTDPMEEYNIQENSKDDVTDEESYAPATKPYTPETTHTTTTTTSDEDITYTSQIPTRYEDDETMKFTDVTLTTGKYSTEMDQTSTIDDNDMITTGLPGGYQENNNSNDDEESSSVETTSFSNYLTSVSTETTTPELKYTTMFTPYEDVEKNTKEVDQMITSLGTTQTPRTPVRYSSRMKYHSRIQSTTKEPQVASTTEYIANRITTESSTTKEPKAVLNRKKLFSNSRRRLPPTSAIIRRRLKKKDNETYEKDDKEVVKSTPIHINTEKELKVKYHTVTQKSETNEIDTSTLMPVGFKTVPEIISPMKLLEEVTIGEVLKMMSTTGTTLNPNDEVSESYTNETPKVLEGVQLPNIRDEILDLIRSDESGYTRLKRILELRNMTLTDLLEHRERGSSQLHFSEAFRSTTPASSTENITNSPDPSSTIKEPEPKPTQVTNTPSPPPEHETEKDIETEFDQKQDESKYNLIMRTVEASVIPIPMDDGKKNDYIQFPEQGVLKTFPTFLTDTIKKEKGRYREEGKVEEDFQGKKHGRPILKEPSIKFYIDSTQDDRREPRQFESGSKNFTENKLQKGNSSSEQTMRPFRGESKELVIAVTSVRPKPVHMDDVLLFNEIDEIHRSRTKAVGKISAETETEEDSRFTDFTSMRKFPPGVKSAILASGAVLGIAILGFLTVLVSCRLRQRSARLRAKRDILCEQLQEDFRSSQCSLSPVLSKHQRVPVFSSRGGIHSNTSSNRHYYLWRTLRKTFQYE